MAMYTAFLASGHTLAQRQIKAATIRCYLRNAASFIRLFDHDMHRDARYTAGTHAFCTQVQKILTMVERYEKVPNRQEAYTLAMQKALHLRTTDLADKQPDCLVVTLFQWFGVALQGGNRRCEWCQPPSHADVSTFELSPTGEARAFTLADIEFFTSRKRALPLVDALRHPEMAHHVRVTYRWQKNSDHGQKKTYVRNTSNRACDTVGHLLKICARYARLRGMSRTDQPLAIYRAHNGVVRNITSDNVSAQMRDLARTVYDISSAAGLKKFTSHSLRVGACCILWAKGLSGEFIQRALRWRSESWKDYIRDLTVQSEQHNDAMNDTWELPAF